MFLINLFTRQKNKGKGGDSRDKSPITESDNKLISATNPNTDRSVDHSLMHLRGIDSKTTVTEQRVDHSITSQLENQMNGFIGNRQSIERQSLNQQKAQEKNQKISNSYTDNTSFGTTEVRSRPKQQASRQKKGIASTLLSPEKRTQGSIPKSIDTQISKKVAKKEEEGNSPPRPIGQTFRHANSQSRNPKRTELESIQVKQEEQLKQRRADNMFKRSDNYVKRQQSSIAKTLRAIDSVEKRSADFNRASYNQQSTSQQPRKDHLVQAGSKLLQNHPNNHAQNNRIPQSRIAPIQSKIVSENQNRYKHLPPPPQKRQNDEKMFMRQKYQQQQAKNESQTSTSFIGGEVNTSLMRTPAPLDPNSQALKRGRIKSSQLYQSNKAMPPPRQLTQYLKNIDQNSIQSPYSGYSFQEGGNFSKNETRDQTSSIEEPINYEFELKKVDDLQTKNENAFAHLVSVRERLQDINFVNDYSSRTLQSENNGSKDFDQN